MNYTNNKSFLIIVFSALCVPFLLCSFKPFHETYFEGIIKFNYEYILKSDKVSADKLKEFFGTSAELYFKEGNYLERYDKGELKEQLYRKKDNCLFFRNRTNDTVTFSNTTKPGKDIINTEINLNKDTVLGNVCHELIVHYADYTFTLYFNRDYSIDTDWYKDYKRNGKDIFSRLMKAVYIKFKLEYKDFIVIGTATEINRKKLDDSIFEIKKHEILIAKKE